MSSQKTEFTCPSCGEEIRERFTAIRPGSSTECPHCGSQITYTPENISRISQEGIDRCSQTIMNILESCVDSRKPE